MGEVDLIARRGKMVAFIEVKARTSAADLDFAIDERRLSRVAAAARTLAAKYARPGDDMRIDVMLIAPRRFPRHLVNVWHGGWTNATFMKESKRPGKYNGNDTGRERRWKE